MTKLSKRFQDIEKNFDLDRRFSLEEAIKVLKELPGTKFNQTLEVSLKLGVDPKKADQQVRGTVALPHGTGKELRIVVFAAGDKADEAKKAGADHVGHEELVQKVSAGWTDFDAVVATPDMMREVGKLGKVLGPRGLMPSPKAGTVTNDIAKAVEELKAGRVEYKTNKNGVINHGVGKLTAFEPKQLKENVEAFIRAIQRAKPASSKGRYMLKLVLSGTMTPGLEVDVKELEVA